MSTHVKPNENLINVKEEIERSAAFGEELEDLIVKRGTLTFVDQTRDRILLAYWSLVLDARPL